VYPPPHQRSTHCEQTLARRGAEERSSAPDWSAALSRSKAACSVHTKLHSDSRCSAAWSLSYVPSGRCALRDERGVIASLSFPSLLPFSPPLHVRRCNQSVRLHVGCCSASANAKMGVIKRSIPAAVSSAHLPGWQQTEAHTLDSAGHCRRMLLAPVRSLFSRPAPGRIRLSARAPTVCCRHGSREPCRCRTRPGTCAVPDQARHLRSQRQSCSPT